MENQDVESFLYKQLCKKPAIRSVEDIRKEHETFWDNLSDKVAAVGGSWPFIFTFIAVLFSWMLLNTDVLAHWRMVFDPYPYIFLNLMLSTLAAIQAPIIMMSQNRQSAKDRIAAQNDYEVNLRAEMSLIALHEKIDTHLARIVEQQAELVAIERRKAASEHSDHNHKEDIQRLIALVERLTNENRGT